MIAFLWGDNLIVVALRLAFRSIIVANFGCLFAEYSFRLIVHFFFAHHKLRYLSNWYIILKERAKNRIEIGSSIDLCHQYYVIYFWGRFEGGIKIFESMLINWNIILWFLKGISFFISLWIKKLKYEWAAFFSFVVEAFIFVSIHLYFMRFSRLLTVAILLNFFVFICEQIDIETFSYIIFIH